MYKSLGKAVSFFKLRIFISTQYIAPSIPDTNETEEVFILVRCPVNVQ